MFLDPMAITINVAEDNNTLKVPSISPVDGRMIRERLHSDSHIHEKKKIRSALSTPTPSFLDDQPYVMKRPVSDQNINMNNKRKEKAVSWHSKIPTSTQTLGCVEGVSDDRIFSDKHAQSQPLLGTLESNSSKKHICRHTYSVRQVRSPSKEGQKPRYLRRCVSSGNDRQKFREKYLQLRPTNKVKDCSSPLTIANEAHLAAQLNMSKQNSLDDTKCEELSLIDWAEDEKLCDEEVGNITGIGDEEEDDIKPTLTHIHNSNFHINETLDVQMEGDMSKYPELVSNSFIHSNSESIDKKSCDETLYCDQKRSNYASANKKDNSVVEQVFPASPTVTSALPLQQSVPESLLDVPIPAEHVQQRSSFMNSLTDQLSCDNTLRIGRATLDERRPPLQKQTGESHL